ncbi:MULTISPECIES: Clp protease N-terminal domain-containing protein [Streptomyces]|uniref:ATP-dependent Clp protease ATP-binding subunit ClpA n=1 Tax=Streptomyces clavifer TaxID=68188 RepID=A0ABS4V5E4_9ACTN|nr:MULTISPECIES: Clp protease N-terminal domain-containing protein [Streptomyces]MBP2359122.1 ATP-dependent Clp protease ATP-binding subunit ClpA [Streptomyces clavifer]MDX2745797.1 Clp protease N-terminal domain-containing protein [Streptomyces sp. NRRL_B-2557]MDX3061979.1 Clp protease N-terminal domain-containing protein [Streptomyces sp. ND04-05B]RPK81207.1 ATP-dependent Clp protease ATP-binding subunit ClpC1 [Streptomyces sp. ADI97-07]GHA82381.1 peptidase [Streptomyces clavifer]
MFERFTKGARAAVTGAVTHAERAGADSVTEEHLLLSLLDQKGGRSSFAVVALGLTDRRASMESAFAEARRRGGLTKADAEALAGIGIDVTEIVAKVEGAHGEGALAGDRRSRRWWSAHRPFTAGAKGILEKSLRVALGRGDRFIGEEHVLLALTACPGVVADVLADHGATYATVERALYGAGGEGQARAS